MIALLIAFRAHAWDHTGDVWELQDTPLQVIVDPTMPDAEGWLAAFQHAADAWAASPTKLALAVEMAESGPLTQYSSPGTILVSIDCHGQVGADVPAVTWHFPTGVAAYVSSGRTYHYFDEADIFINDTETFVGIDEPCEGNESIRELVAVHELGHALGMGHSCEEDDICADELLASAVMYWDDRGCTANRTPNADDLDGFAHLYDAAGSWAVTSGDYIGKTPREVCFAIEPNNIDADHVAWEFGDGTTGEGDEVCHTFEGAGEHVIGVDYFSEPDDDAPRSWSSTILACASPPGPIEGADHLFDLRTIGTQIEILPTVDAHWPCVESLRWSVLRGGETLFELPVSNSLVDVGHYGEYTVVLRTGGYGGVGEEEQTITLAAEEDPSSGCSTLRPRGVLALIGLVMAALSRRRFGVEAASPDRENDGRAPMPRKVDCR